MGFRFRRSVKVAPGIRLNIGKQSQSFTLGGRGASLNISSRGARPTLSLPGTGIAWSPSGARSRAGGGSGGGCGCILAIASIPLWVGLALFLPLPWAVVELLTWNHRPPPGGFKLTREDYIGIQECKTGQLAATDEINALHEQATSARCSTRQDGYYDEHKPIAREINAGLRVAQNHRDQWADQEREIVFGPFKDWCDWSAFVSATWAMRGAVIAWSLYVVDHGSAFQTTLRGLRSFSYGEMILGGLRLLGSMLLGAFVGYLAGKAQERWWMPPNNATLREEAMNRWGEGGTHPEATARETSWRLALDAAGLLGVGILALQASLSASRAAPLPREPSSDAASELPPKADSTATSETMPSACGDPQRTPAIVLSGVWTQYRCVSKDVAGVAWPICLKRTDYSPVEGTGCPGEERCCPPSSAPPGP